MFLSLWKLFVFREECLWLSVSDALFIFSWMLISIVKSKCYIKGLCTILFKKGDAQDYNAKADFQGDLAWWR